MTLILLALALQSDPEGSPEQLMLYRLARNYNRPSAVDASLESMGWASSRFATRYAALLVKLHRALDSGRLLQPTHASILKLAGSAGSKAAQEHLKALAESFKKAVSCPDCTGGKVSCGDCQGKGRRDVTCAPCNGSGRVRPAGAIGGTDITVKCRNCEGRKFFKNASCGTCSRTGFMRCHTCAGNPWREMRCVASECVRGRVPCDACQGTGKLKVPCTECDGGRTKASGAVGDAPVTFKCRACSIDGIQGNGFISGPCKACASSGKVTCTSCGGPFSSGAKAGSGAVAFSDVFATEPCAECSGAGWPDLRKAVPCAKCSGLGGKIKPITDPGKTLE